MNNDLINTFAEAQNVDAKRIFMSRVYAWMFGGLLATALTAFIITTNENILETIGSLFFVFILAEFGLVILLTSMINKMSKSTAVLAFMGYAILNGVTFSVILFRYSESAVFSTFFITSGIFALLSLFGFVTKKDLSPVGNFFFAGLVGIILASVVYMFFPFGALNFAISVIGVIIFAGLTAYDTQKIKNMYILQAEGDEIATKGAIMGALTLYLDFINLFLFILRLTGSRR